eukprot:12546-Prymnesium_polylepis.2
MASQTLFSPREVLLLEHEPRRLLLVGRSEGLPYDSEVPPRGALGDLGGQRVSTTSVRLGR